MPFAVTHALLTLFAVLLYFDFFQKKTIFPPHTIFIAALAGLLPDLDIPLSGLLNLLGIPFPLLDHRGILHSPFFGLLFFIPAVYFMHAKKRHLKIYSFLLSLGVLFHIFLDYLIGVGDGHLGLPFLWPFNAVKYPPLLALFHIQIPIIFYLGLDAILLLVFILYDEYKHKIKNFI
ncbi:metal-dependent hydrolase [Candidatus Woesearchaeota archaeon]|nr:metal-dependent hydrolase [Candidatus Woesearchaeota archaeon]